VVSAAECSLAFELVNACSSDTAKIALTFLAFDLLSLEGRDLTSEPYRERRRILEGLALEGPCWWVPEAFCRWAGAVGSSLRARARGRRGEAAARALSVRRAALGEGEESRLLAV
jgi:hypothetical protein